MRTVKTLVTLSYGIFTNRYSQKVFPFLFQYPTDTGHIRSEHFNYLFTFSLWDVFLGTPDKHIAFQAMINDEVLGNGTVIVFDQVNTNLGQG